MINEKLRNRAQLYIKPASKKKRIDLVDYLESQGFGYEGFAGRKEVLDSFLPVVADVEKKRIGRMGNVTVAACAASSKAIMSDEEFYELLSEIRLP